MHTGLPNIAIEKVQTELPQRAIKISTGWDARAQSAFFSKSFLKFNISTMGRHFAKCLQGRMGPNLIPDLHAPNGFPGKIFAISCNLPWSRVSPPPPPRKITCRAVLGDVCLLFMHVCRFIYNSLSLSGCIERDRENFYMHCTQDTLAVCL